MKEININFLKPVYKKYDENYINKKLEDISLILIIISMIFIGADKIAFEIAGLTVRVVQIVLVLETIILVLQRKYKIIISIPIIAVVISHLISTIFSKDVFQSIAYDFWLIYNFIFVLYLFYSWAISQKKSRVINIILFSFTVQSIYIYIQFIWGLLGNNDFLFPMQNYMNIYRPSLWFYEPSYLATYFSIYFAISLFLLVEFRNKKYIIHTINSFFSIIFITSTVGYLSIGFTILIVMIINIKKIIKVNKKIIGGIILGIITLIIVISFLDIHFIDVFLGRIFESGITEASGERVYNWGMAIDIFKQNPIVGIGPNAYPAYSMTGKPPTNVTLEILANTGIIGFISFISFVGWILYKCYKKAESPYNRAIVLGIVVFIVTLQSNQNYMRLYLWMFLGIALAFAKKKRTI